MDTIRKHKLYFQIGAALITLGAVVFVVSFFIPLQEKEEAKTAVSDKEIAERAKSLGMIYPSDYAPDNVLSPDNLEPSNDSESLTDDEIIKRAKELGMTLQKPDSEETAVSEGNTVRVSIPSGLSASEIAKRLQAAGVVDDSAKFAKFVADAGMSRNINSGEYDIKKGLEYADILAIISKKYKR